MPPCDRLTEKETQVAVMVWQGLTNRDIGLAIGTSFWGLGIVAGLVTAVILFVADSFPDPVREAKQEPTVAEAEEAKANAAGPLKR